MAKGTKLVTQRFDAQVIPVAKDQTRDWYAWNDLQPPGPVRFHVVGEVLIGNPGVETVLAPQKPQGFNQNILLLELILKQQPGMWPQIEVWAPARYDKVRTHYTEVQIFHNGTAIASVPAQDVH